MKTFFHDRQRALALGILLLALSSGVPAGCPGDQASQTDPSGPDPARPRNPSCAQVEPLQDLQALFYRQLEPSFVRLFFTFNPLDPVDCSPLPDVRSLHLQAKIVDLRNFQTVTARRSVVLRNDYGNINWDMDLEAPLPAGDYEVRISTFERPGHELGRTQFRVAGPVSNVRVLEIGAPVLWTNGVHYHVKVKWNYDENAYPVGDILYELGIHVLTYESPSQNFAQTNEQVYEGDLVFGQFVTDWTQFEFTVTPVHHFPAGSNSVPMFGDEGAGFLQPLSPILLPANQ